MEEKYIDLLLNKCVDLNSSKILFIHYYKEIKEFINKLVEKAKKIGFEEFYLEEIDPIELHDKLANNKIETSSDLESYYIKKNGELKLALGERGILWDRRASKKNEDIRQELCNQISEKTEIINRLRKEVLLCEDIKTRIPKMKENLNEIKKEKKAREEELEFKKNKRKEKCL